MLVDRDVEQVAARGDCIDRHIHRPAVVAVSFLVAFLNNVPCLFKSPKTAFMFDAGGNSWSMSYGSAPKSEKQIRLAQLVEPIQEWERGGGDREHAPQS